MKERASDAHFSHETVSPSASAKRGQPPPRLIEQMNEGQLAVQTLIAAPAGFGKTTLVSAWLAGGAQPATWLSLDARENDPARFLAYLVAALQTIGEGVLGVLQSPQPSPTEKLPPPITTFWWVQTSLLS